MWGAFQNRYWPAKYRPRRARRAGARRPAPLYRTADLPAADVHRLTLAFEAGVEGYAFTFG